MEAKKRSWRDAFDGVQPGPEGSQDHADEHAVQDLDTEELADIPLEHNVVDDGEVQQETESGVGNERGTSTVQPRSIQLNLGLDREMNANNVVPNLLPSVHASIGAHVANTIKEKIALGQYIELEALLSLQMQDSKDSQISLNDNGELVVKPKSHRKQIKDIETWTEAMLIYSSIFLLAHPNKIQEILKYISTIRLGAKRHGGMNWSLYDQQFRLRLAADPISMSFGKIDYELWLIFMGGNELQHVNARQINNFSVKKCYDFNYRQCFRPKCYFRHICLICDLPHPFRNCFRNRRSTNISWRAPVTQGQPRLYAPNRGNKQQLTSTKYMH